MRSVRSVLLVVIVGVITILFACVSSCSGLYCQTYRIAGKNTKQLHRVIVVSVYSWFIPAEKVFVKYCFGGCYEYLSSHSHF